jgi:predicted PurR-regulated permease PerM
MKTETNKLVEQIFFYSIFALAAYFVWKLFSPFLSAIALSVIIVTICYPLYLRVLERFPAKNGTIASLITLCIIILCVVVPLTILGSLILREAVSVYSLFNSESSVSFMRTVESLETSIQNFVPNFSIDVAGTVQQTARFFVDHLLTFFAGTASTIFLFFVTLIASFYFFRDGKQFTQFLIRLSPLNDVADSQILHKLAISVRSVALGTVSIAMLQGVLTSIGFSLFDFNRAILWGCVAAIGALIPGVGTAIVFIPAVIYLLATGAGIPALFLGLWGAIAVGLIDNVVGPYVMSRGNNLHPFLLLLSVLGGIVSFGPIGFILGPVILSFFVVLFEIYYTHIKNKQS